MGCIKCSTTMIGCRRLFPVLGLRLRVGPKIPNRGRPQREGPSKAASRYFEFNVRSDGSMARCAIMDTLDPTISRNAPALKRLAHALDVPVERFLSEPHANEVGDLLNLMRLWSQIEDNQGRRRVLNVARQEAERGSHNRRA